MLRTTNFALSLLKQPNSTFNLAVNNSQRPLLSSAATTNTAPGIVGGRQSDILLVVVGRRQRAGLGCAMTDTAPISVTAVAVAVGLLALTAGYFLGQGSSIGLFANSSSPNDGKKSWPNSYDVKVHADSSAEEGADEDDDDADEEDAGNVGDGRKLKDFEDTAGEVKLVLAVRSDLGMSKGSSCPRSVFLPF